MIPEIALHIISFVFVLGALIFFHELGHFLVARWCGVGVLKFAIGFGPGIAKFERNGTVYQIGIIPLGGFVRMVGDLPEFITGDEVSSDVLKKEELREKAIAEKEEELSPAVKAMIEDKSKWFIEKKLWQRSLIVFAGPLFNFILSIVIITGLVFSYGKTDFDKRAVIGSISAGSPAEASGLKVGDLVKTLNGEPVKTWSVLAKTIHDGKGQPIELKVIRENGKEKTINIVPLKKNVKAVTGVDEERFLVGIGPKFYQEKAGAIESIKAGFVGTYYYTKMTTTGIFGMFTGSVSTKDLGGPIYIFDLAGQYAKKGAQDLLNFMAALSVSLAVLNLLPVPVLDGGHLLFFLIEAIAGPISIKKREFAQQIGVFLLLGLMVFAIVNDITRDAQKIEQSITWDSK